MGRDATERLEVIDAVLGRTHILLWQRKFFYSPRKKKDSARHATRPLTCEPHTWITMNTEMRNENISSPFDFITGQTRREYLSFYWVNIVIRFWGSVLYFMWYAITSAYANESHKSTSNKYVLFTVCLFCSTISKS